MGHRIEILTKGSTDFSAEGLASSPHVRVYNINDNTLTIDEIAEIERLFADPIVDLATSDRSVLLTTPYEEGRLDVPTHLIEMSPRPAVSDPEGEEAKEAIERVIGREIGGVSYANQFLWRGDLNENIFAGLRKGLGNPVINEFRRTEIQEWDPLKGIPFHFPSVDLPKVPAFSYLDIHVSDQLLMRMSDDRLLALNLEEMTTVKNQFNNPVFTEERASVGLGSRPADAEMECLGQTWSEHCCHKKFNALWEYTSDDPNDEAGLPFLTDSVFKSIIVAATEKISENRGFLVSVFEDNAGVIRLNDRWNISHKVETHNHPTSLDGYGGAGTGIGGVIRDNKSTGTGMRLVSCQYAYRHALPGDYLDLPYKIQSPARTLETVISGVEDYGNRMGIPTACGNLMFGRGWLKPAVYVGGVAVAKAEINGRKTHLKDVKPGYIALNIGGRVGKDGIHGATGSSDSLDADAEESEQLEQSVQIGNPIVEKGVFEVMNYLQELDLIEAAQDCGAGGWNSAVGELAGLLNETEQKRYELQSAFKEKGITKESSLDERFALAAPIIDLEKKASPFNDALKESITSGEIFSRESHGKGGVVMDLTHAPEKYAGLEGWEKLISEAQEREVIVIKPENLDRILEICKHNNVEATQIAEFNDSGFYHVKDQDKTMVYLPMDFLRKGLPQWRIQAHWKPPELEEPSLPVLEDLTDSLLSLVGQPNMQIFDWISTRYDHEVQGGSLIKPLVGLGRGRSDAIAYQPILTEKEVVIESLGSNPWQGDIDAYHMGKNNVVDAVGKIIAAGGSLDKITFNGNTTCPKPEKDPNVAAKVIRMLKGAADAEIAFGTPTISGKDSTSMERDYKSTETGEDVYVKAKTELLMSGLGVIPDDSTLTTCDFKLPGDVVYVVGDTRDELGASEFYLMHDETGKNVPKSDLQEIKERYLAMTDVIKQGIVHSSHYLGKGGLGFALANSSIAGDLGVEVNLDPTIKGGVVDRVKQLFSETTGRFLVTVHHSQQEAFEKAMQGQYVERIGNVRADSQFNISYNGKEIVKTDVNTIRKENKGKITPEALKNAA